ncbi:MAG: VanZ family protein [Patescibacteria group bacterium]|nr:VanZ family protein [Patescibacteria group bacterium]
MSKLFTMTKWWLAVAGWMAVIFCFSNQPNLRSELVPVWDFVFRKIAHLSEYFVLSYLVWRALRKNEIENTAAIFSAIFFSLLYSVTDEWHQSFIVGRESNIHDVGIDLLGMLFFGFLSIIKK